MVDRKPIFIFRGAGGNRHAQLIWGIPVKSKTAAKVLMHSDGSVYALIPDLIDIGVDVLNPCAGVA